MKNVLVICAHSDDETLGCGGAIALHSSRGDQVSLMVMTDGVSSRRRSSQEVDKLQRSHSLKGAAELLGVSEVFQYNFPDNLMDSVPRLSVVKEIEECVRKVRPSIVYTHYIGDLNIDHRITSDATQTALRFQPGSDVECIYQFETLSSSDWNIFSQNKFIPNYFLDISNVIELKKQALTMYTEEIRDWPHQRSLKALDALALKRGSEVGYQYAEAYMSFCRAGSLK